MTMSTSEENAEIKEISASKIVNRYVWWSMGAGLIIPIPVADLAALSVLQLHMLSALSNHYDIPFMRNAGKSVIATLVGHVTTKSMYRNFLTTFLRSLPIGKILGATSMSIYCGATTYAIGKLFVQHFESGGTFLDLKPYKVKKYFEELYIEGKEFVSKVKSG